MGRLKTLVIADPSPQAAQHIADETSRLAERREIVQSGEATLAAVRKHKPEMVMVSLELHHPGADDLVEAIRAHDSDVFVVATFRELSVPAMDRLGRLGVEDFIPIPIDFTQLYRTASARFGTFFRRHARFQVAVDLLRVDGLKIGRSIDISEGGIRMECEHPVHPDHSLLLDLMLATATPSATRKDGVDKVRVRCHVIAVDPTSEDAKGRPRTGEVPDLTKKRVARAQFQNLRGEEQRRLAEFLSQFSGDPE